MNNKPDQVITPLLLSSGRRRRFLLVCGIYLLLWQFTWLSASLLDRFGIVSPWYLPAGLRFFCLLVFGWSGLLLELTANLLCGLLQFTMPIDLASVFLSNRPSWLFYGWVAPVFAYAAVLLPLRRWLRDLLDFSRPAHSALFLVAALAASTLAALAGTFRMVYTDFLSLAQWSSILPVWLIGDFIGVVTLVPLLLVRVAPGLQHYLQQGRWYRPELQSGAANGSADLRTTLIVMMALLLVFGIPWSLEMTTHFPLIALLLLLPLAWVALNYGLRGAVLAVVLLDSGLVLLIALFDQREHALQYQFVMIAIALVGLWLGGAVEARNRIMRRYRDFARVSNDLLWETDAAGRLCEASGRLAKRGAPWLGQSWRSLLCKGSQPQLAALEQALSEQQPFHHLEIAFQGTGDNARWVQLNGLPLRDESGDLSGYRGTAIDVSRSHRAKALLRSYNKDLLEKVAERTHSLNQTNSELEIKERRLQVLLAAAPVGVLELDDADCCRYLNTNGCALTGCTPEQAQGLSVLEFVHPDDRSYFEFVWDIKRQSPEVHLLEFRLKRTNLWCAAYWIKLSHPGQSLDGTIMVLTNTTARRQQDERLWTLAHHDALTELPNRNLFRERIGQALAHARRRASGAAVLWIDLDGFKAVNDSLGHAAGDVLLQQVAQRLKSRIRESDTVARMGGDEFAVIITDITEPGMALQIANEMGASLAKPFTLAQGVAHITGSIGVALYPLHADTVEALTQCADMAMYSAKNSGKNQVKVWNGE